MAATKSKTIIYHRAVGHRAWSLTDSKPPPALETTLCTAEAEPLIHSAVMAYIVMAYIFMVYIVMTHIVMGYIVMA